MREERATGRVYEGYARGMRHFAMRASLALQFLVQRRFSMRTLLLAVGLALAFAACDPAGPTEATLDSGGPLRPEQGTFDVTFYDLALRIDPADSTVAGSLLAEARIVHPTARLVLDLDARLGVQAVRMGEGEAAVATPFERRGGRVWIDLGRTRQPGETVRVAVDYHGRPRVAPQPPWQGGFTWARTSEGAPWIATTVQREGADLWWPVKDHVSDEPDSMALHFTVPRPLVAASNGRLRRVEDHGDGWRTYHWFVSTPINVYNVTLAAAPYQPVETTYTSVTGESLPVIFYVLPGDRARGEAFLPEILDHLRFFETALGPYPFRADKYGVVQTPHLGMEHQTLIAYGAAFDNGAMTGGRDFGFDALHHHELAHEWWGNLVTNADWRDMWLHEGFATYMQALYAEHRDGRAAYHAYMAHQRAGIENRRALAPLASRSAYQIYGGDLYRKGAWVLHTLRFLIGEEALRTALRRFAYPDSTQASQAAGCPSCRFVTTDDFVRLVEQITGRDLEWFFEVYARRAALPRLAAEHDGDTLRLAWIAPEDLPFPMPVQVRLGDAVRRVEMPEGRASVPVPPGAEPVIDPDAWILRDE